jgi:hypothetical protein
MFLFFSVARRAVGSGRECMRGRGRTCRSGMSNTTVLRSASVCGLEELMLPPTLVHVYVFPSTSTPPSGPLPCRAGIRPQ